MKAFLIGCLLVLGCTVAPGEEQHDPNSQHWRDQFPNLSDGAPGCVTLWVVEGDCTVSDGVTKGQCVASDDPLMVRRAENPHAFCTIGYNRGCDCSNQRLETE